MTDDMELSIRWSPETEELGNEVWCSKAAADAILRLANQKERLESRLQKLDKVVDAVRRYRDDQYFSDDDLYASLAELDQP